MAAAKKKPAGPTQVDAIIHGDKRTNIPTADSQDFIGAEVETVQQLRWPRDPSLDPQLVWKGKDVDADELVADAPPIYIQEKIDPRVLIENLRDTARRGEAEPEMTLFDGFDGLNELDMVEFYKHQANWSNRMILGDSLQVMGSLAEREGLRGKVQMIYLDPPYGIKFGSNWQVSTRKRDVKDGKYEDATFEVEQIKAFRDTWELGIHSYLQYLRDRLMVARDLLTESGSVFVQIGDENVHLVRSLMDEVFGSENFVGQIVFQTTTGSGSPSGTTDVLARVADHLLWFSRSADSVKYRELLQFKGIGGFIPTAYGRVEESGGSRRPALSDERTGALPEGARLYALGDLTSASGVDKTRYPVQLGGKTWTPGAGVWKTSEAGMANLIRAHRVEATSSRLGYVRYLDDFPAVRYTNVWQDTVSSFMADKVYVVQTNTKVIERCMLMCTDPGDLVLDPTCGSGTTAYVAEQWGRRWITCDTSRVALALARQRLMASKFPYFLLADSPEGRAKEQALTGAPLPISESRGDIRQGFVYERVQHITLKSIANNPDIREGMTRDEIDAAIKRHADFELLYDKPYEDSKKVRVAGPFTVESLSPHRSIAFAGQAPGPTTTRSEEAGEQASAGDFEQMILDNLRKAGIQNGRRNERLTFATIEPCPGVHVHAIGERETDDATSPKRVGVVVGPQYGTVGSRQIMDAAKEAVKARDGQHVIDLLVVLAFAFDPQALGSGAADGASYVSTDAGFADVQAERSLGKLPVLLVRMNNDLVMGDDLKKTGAGNLFTVFGEPDIDIRAEGDQVVVEVRGVDVYDPTTGIVRSQQTDQIALWMIDTNYNEESFFVRHCYFTGGNDPFARLKRALKSDIDEEAWESLYSTVSRPFPKPETGKIAIKVINDYGDEVLQVFEVM
jgi:adenine-specific DNA-methyltransferase